jgi:hypothetical protein
VLIITLPLSFRHGARLPTDDVNEEGPFFGRFLSNLTESETTFNFHGPLRFLRDWKYNLGVNILTRSGSQQLYDSGVQSFYRYASLYDSSSQARRPVIRTTSQSRIVESADSFILGFFGESGSSLVDREVLIEAPLFNSTLSPGESCLNGGAAQLGDAKIDTWLSAYLKGAVDRLQEHIQGFMLTPRLVFGMQSLCAYETFALGFSDFCPLFTKAEWRGFSYAFDLYDSWNLFTHPNGPAQGIGWSQEVVSRLNQTMFQGPVTSQNTSLTSNATFSPLIQPLYFDFSHDTTIVSVLAALNFTQFASKLNPEALDTERHFMTSHITPFAARLFIEVSQSRWYQ